MNPLTRESKVNDDNEKKALRMFIKGYSARFAAFLIIAAKKNPGQKPGSFFVLVSRSDRAGSAGTSAVVVIAMIIAMIIAAIAVWASAFAIVITIAGAVVGAVCTVMITGHGRSGNKTQYQKNNQ
jgi:cobalamin synthase